MWEFLAGAALVKFLCGSSGDSTPASSPTPSRPERLDLAAIEANKHIAMDYGFRRKSSIRFVVRSSDPVDVYFVDEGDVEKFRKKESFSYYSKFNDVTTVEDEYVVRRGDYSLLIVNRGSKTAAVSYGLWTRS
mgnify:CR=1 FL=1